MKAYDDMEYYPKMDKLVEILCQKTQNTNPLFFRILTSYYLSKIASMMRCTIKTLDRGVLPVNMYAVNLAISGQGKGYSTNIIEDEIINQFREKFTDETLYNISQINLAKIANQRASRKGTDPDDELEKVTKEYDRLGELAFSFDSGTTAAVKQMRHKLLMAAAGSMNMEIDEIGSNLLGNVDVLTTYLELFDVGKVKQKLTKNTEENTRSAEIEGKTPTNMMLFGTPTKLLDGGKTEEEWVSFLETGYARRCFFGYQTASTKALNLTPEEILDMLTDTSANACIHQLSDELHELADMVHFNKVINISRDVTLLLIEYRQECEVKAENLPDYQEIQKAELSHRYFKALKLAGTYAFIDQSPDLTEEHLYAAIKLAEDSGKAFNEMLTRDKNYVKLAKYISSIDREVTHVDLMEELPCYKGSESIRREMMTHAISWGCRHNIIIKRNITDGIEFLRGEAMKEVDKNSMLVSYGTKMAEGYLNDIMKFSDISKLTQMRGYQWVTHHLVDGYRKEDCAMQGCDMVVLDVDGGTTLEQAQLLLADYTYHMHTTKSYTPKKHRYRIILPLTHHVKLDATDFKEFMNNIYDWLPFEVDTQTNQRSRKWETNPGDFYENEGISLDSIQFIPKTKKADDFKSIVTDLQGLNNVERWFAKEMAEGNRNQHFIRYAYMLVDSGMDFTSIQNSIMQLNAKLPAPLPDTEILGTIMQSTSKRIIARDA